AARSRTVCPPRSSVPAASASPSLPPAASAEPPGKSGKNSTGKSKAAFSIFFAYVSFHFIQTHWYGSAELLFSEQTAHDFDLPLPEPNGYYIPSPAARMFPPCQPVKRD